MCYMIGEQYFFLELNEYSVKEIYLFTPKIVLKFE